MAKQIWKPGNMVYPLPAVMVSTGDKKRKSEYSDGSVDRNCLYESCNGIHISASGTLFLSYDRRKR